MADTDLIAVLYPFEEQPWATSKQHATDTIVSNRRSRPPMSQRRPELPRARDARESTEPLEGSTDGRDKLLFLPRLELRFSDGPRASAGFVFGKDPDTADVVLPNIRGISRRHFALTFRNDFSDKCYRLVVRDLGSIEGTMVTYDGHGKRARSSFDWIVAGFAVPHESKRLVVQPSQYCKFQLVVAPHNPTSLEYIRNVERFLGGAADSDTLFGALRLQSGPHTERNTAAHTPGNRPILINRGLIGRGKYGVVTRYWNVSTGEDYACKTPAGDGHKKHRWEREIAIMGSVQHPSLYMEYMEFGNLCDENSRCRFSFAECLDIFRQSLSALVYLHGRREPIAHRDLKPGNILVRQRDPLHVKLADFGLAKKGSLETHCGTWTYAAPEIQADSRARGHTVAVDIWSLAVVILELAYRLPHPGHGMGIWWCKAIVDETNGREPDGVIDILQRMLNIEASARDSAATCLDTLEGWLQPPAAPPLQEQYDDDSVLWPQLGSLWAPSISVEGRDATESVATEQSGSRARRHGRSDAPSPESRALTRVLRRRSGSGTARPPALRSVTAERARADARSTGGRRGRHPLGFSIGNNHSNPFPGEAAEFAAAEADGAAEVPAPNPWSQALDYPGPPPHTGILPDESQYPVLNPSEIVTPSAFLPLSRFCTDARQPEEGGACLPSPLDLRPVDHHPVADGTYGQLGEQVASPAQALAAGQEAEQLPPIIPQDPFDQILQKVVRGSPVSMRASDFSLNATEIFLAAGANRRKSHLEKLRRRGYPMPRTHPLWLPFKDGVFLCQAVGQAEELQPLLLRAGVALPGPEGNYFLRRYPAKRQVRNAPRNLPAAPPEGFELLSRRDRKVAYKPLERTVNATQLCSLGGISRSRVSVFLRKNPGIAKEVLVGNALVQGTYISYADAAMLCGHFNLSQEPVQYLMALGGALDNADQS